MKNILARKAIKRHILNLHKIKDSFSLEETKSIFQDEINDYTEILNGFRYQ